MDDQYRNRQRSQRNDYGERGYTSDRSSRQPQQFQRDAGMQSGDQDYDQDYSRRERGQFGDYGNPHRDFQSDYDGGQRSNYGAQNDFDDATGAYESRGGVNRTRQSHSYFRGDEYGGEAYARGGAVSPGYAASDYGYGGAFEGGQGYGRDRHRAGNRNDRGFLEKAGDHVASWFGDDDAERRLERDHSGRGPSNYKRSDERILDDACDRLTDDPRLDARNIQVTVEDGEVTLDGKVDSRWSKRRAEDCAHDVSGVGHVQNNLRIDEDLTYDTDRDRTVRNEQTIS